MASNRSKQFGAALLWSALLMSLLVFTACSSGPAQEIKTVEVHVTDQHLEMPASLPTGPTTFQVTNTGNQEHSFGLTGPAGDLRLAKTLKPGESGSLDVYLDAGTYRVFCPVVESQGHTMQIALNVHPETSGHS